jgi:hypothetical protein
VVLLLTSLAMACGDPASTTTTAADTGTSDAATTETATTDAALGETASDDATAEDMASLVGDPACLAACSKLAVKGVDCAKRCSSDDPCDQTCITTAKKADDLVDCLGDVATGPAFSEGPYGSGWRTIADDVMFAEKTCIAGQCLGTGVACDDKTPCDEETADWALTEHWTGRDNYLFLFQAANFAYADQLWGSNVKNWLKASPGNVHYFFATIADKNGSDAAKSKIASVQKAVEKAIAGMDARSQCLWSRRIHYGAASVQEMGGPLLKALAASGGQAAIGIDALQQWRQVGLLQTVGGNPDLKLLTYQVRGWNFEAAREAKLAADKALVVPLHSWKDGSHFTVDFELPAGADISLYDTLEFDMAGWCKDHKDENCSEWDTTAHAYLCEIPKTANALATTKCQPAVAEVKAVAEVLGLCGDTTATCTADADCNGAACKGYVAPVKEQKAIAAEIKACTCSDVDGKPVERTQTCKGDGSGFGDCACGCPVEIGRWITPYHREGRWVNEVTPMLTWLGQPGKHRIHFNASNLPMVDFSLRFSKKGDGLRPVKMVDLFTGGGFNQDYNKKYQPKVVNVPAGTKKVELFAWISGHGWGTEAENCAEFCPHTHHFGINGQEFVREHPMAGTAWGCADQIEQGTVPIQFGTWQIGRGGWCPGMDVKPYRVDVTKAIKLGADNTITYKGLLYGQDYVPQSSGVQTNGFPAVMEMNSWLVFYQ